MPKLPTFSTIALVFSGGGFRAAAFALGNLSYLHRVRFGGKPLLENVDFITSSSGGSIAALSYVADLANSKPGEDTFCAYYKHLREDALKEDTLLRQALYELGKRDGWQNNLKSRNLINAFAKAYAKKVFVPPKPTWKLLSQNGEKLPEIAVNATEFHHGLSFRFKSTFRGKGKYYMGADHLFVDNPDIIDNLRLGDIVASSACFPVAFEPLVFPQDFVTDATSLGDWEAAIEHRSRHDRDDRPKSFTLMDGGVVDNQGLGSLRAVQARREASQKNGDLNADRPLIDTVFVVDVDSYYMKPLPAEQMGKINKFSAMFTLQRFAFFGALLVFLALLLPSELLLLLPVPPPDGSEGGLFGAFKNFFEGMAYRIGLATIVGMLLGTLLLVAIMLKKVVQGISGGYLGPEELSQAMEIIGRAPVKYLGLLAKVRARALVTIATSTMLKNTRNLQYELYSEDKKFDGTRISVLIYELATQNESRFDKRATAHKNKNVEELVEAEGGRKELDFSEYLSVWLPNEGKSSSELRYVADIARSFDTTLWFPKGKSNDTYNDRDCIIATGQSTTCYNLLKYLARELKRYNLAQLKEHEDEKREGEFKPHNDFSALSPELEALRLDLVSDWTHLREEPFYFLECLRREARRPEGA